MNNPYFSQELLAPPKPEAFGPFWKSEAGAVFNKPLVDLNVEVVDAAATGTRLLRVLETGFSSREVSRQLSTFYGDAYFNGHKWSGGVWNNQPLELNKPAPYWGGSTNANTQTIPYFYAWLAVSKFALSCLAFKYPKFRVTRAVAFKQPKTTKDLDLRDSEVISAFSNPSPDQEFLWGKMAPLDLGLQSSGTANFDEIVYTYRPKFTNAPETPGVYSVDQNISDQWWLAWSPPEIASTGEEIPNIWNRVKDLFPYPPDATQQQIDRVDLERQWAFRYAARYNWATQFRAFDPPVLRQAEIIDYRAPRQPAWEIPKEYACSTGDPRLVVNCYGDQPAMAWHDFANSGDVGVLIRIRPEIGFPVPKFTLADFGLPDVFWQGVLRNLFNNPDPQIIYKPTIGFNGTFNRHESIYFDADATSLSKYFFLGEPLIEYREASRQEIGRKFRNAEGSNFPFDLGLQKQSNFVSLLTVGPVFQGSGYKPSKVFDENEIPEGYWATVDLAANWGILTFSAAQSVQYAPPLVGLNGKFYVLDETYGYSLVSWAVRFKKTSNQEGALVYSVADLIVTKNGEPVTDYDEPLLGLATWFNNYFLNEARYKKLGELQWKHPNGKEIVKQDLYGHEDFFESFNLTVDCLEE